MKNENLIKLNKVDKQWYLNLILGIILILFSIWIFISSEVVYISLAIVFSITLFLTGVLEIISSIQYKKLLNRWRLSFATGILDLLVSIIVISQPQISSEALTLIMGFVFLYRSVKLITWSTELKNYEAINCGWVLFASIAGVIFSFLFIWNRDFTQLALLFIASFTLLVIGISEIYFSFVLRGKKIELASGV